MLNKKLLIGLAILGGHPNNTNAITNMTQVTVSGIAGMFAGVLTDQALNSVSSPVPSEFKYHKNIITYSCALVAAGLTAWMLNDTTPRAKLKKARAINEQINQSRVMTIYADDAAGYIDSVMRLLVREEYPLLTAFHELELMDDLVNEGLVLLDQALDDASGYLTKESDLIWQQTELDLLKQKINDRLYFIRYSTAFNEEKNNLKSKKTGSTNTVFLDILV